MGSVESLFLLYEMLNGIVRLKYNEAALVAYACCMGSKTTTRSAEETYNALEKFGTDLVALAEEGKLDPVIGRYGHSLHTRAGLWGVHLSATVLFLSCALCFSHVC
jgi:hypothetical protein